MWSQAEIKEFSNLNDVPNKGGKFHKRGNCLALWDAHVEWGELSTSSAFSLPVSLHNKNIKNIWIFDVD